MHTAIFSEKERELITNYLDSGEKGDSFRVLKHRVTQNESTIISDYELMIKFKTSVLKHSKRSTQ